MNKKNIAILGAGSWGTAVAIHLAQAGHRVLLWGHDPQHVALMKEKKQTHAIYLVSIFLKPWNPQLILSSV
ncbi:Glycerol-3-phosphate dehydrogenase [NAD(P)+] [Legionella parisiensis]|uniref:Glycerol-3-phosphate dehydrogenase [NAD(P)+] n=1 Tax=Legionella parisiensis TaxID=45071 RepID=A0A1E5JS57_9GAMM|nr:Glycerol-3-phosphate dehydrogenase [NAD(P)+] [Legionella parisiensis]